ncbi:larval cuticle protein 65Ag1-like [Pollicipes pollicipes]|uniref:larval cuticle protein 65Ag1-like n=1 Tax=Pollicipes pollicipes TaxID=41117 RepID=UPI0018856A6C|nr:larval cuticle protein 65Ag1-like [Pollicipes pollicipes]XP_037082910.1 larval cuticle protein 65Ag1-like [Pollicipes pollicipes]
MKFVVLAAVLAVVAARPQDAPEVAIVRMDSTQGEDGSFQYAYETSDGTNAEVTGESKQIGEEVGTVMRGSYSFVGDDGVTYTVNWVADENGFQAQGDHLPVAPTA